VVDVIGLLVVVEGAKVVVVVESEGFEVVEVVVEVSETSFFVVLLLRFLVFFCL